MTAPQIVAGFRPGYGERIVQMHGEYYTPPGDARVALESAMAREVNEFADRYDPETDLLLTAHSDGVLVGSIVVDGGQTERPGEARLRWFLLLPKCQGHGVGRDLFRRAMDFCRERRFPTVYLWTVEGLPRSLQMYTSAGFRIVERFSGSHYSFGDVRLRLELPLAG